MARSRITIIDTSIILKLIGLDGDPIARDTALEIEQRKESGEQIMLPTTALIEAGNRVAQAPGQRRRILAERLSSVISAAKERNAPWTIPETTWDDKSLDALVGGDSTGLTLVQLLESGRLGTGDIAVLVERDLQKSRIAHVDIDIWTDDGDLLSYS